MPDIFPDIQGQPPASVQIDRPLASTSPGLTFTTRIATPSTFTVDSTAVAEIGISRPLDVLEQFGAPLVLDIYLAYLTFECPPMPNFGGTGQIFPWIGVVAGSDGQSPVLRKTATHIQWTLNGIDWIDLVPLDDIRGPTGAAAYVYTQTTASSSWVINHNLGRHPSVEVFDSLMQEIDAEVTHPSVNQTVVALNPATAGQAHLI